MPATVPIQLGSPAPQAADSGQTLTIRTHRRTALTRRCPLPASAGSEYFGANASRKPAAMRLRYSIRRRNRVEQKQRATSARVGAMRSRGASAGAISASDFADLRACLNCLPTSVVARMLQAQARDCECSHMDVGCGRSAKKNPPDGESFGAFPNVNRRPETV